MRRQATDAGATTLQPSSRAPLAYFVAVFALAWLCWSPAVLAARFGGRPLLPLSLLQALGSWAPVVVAVALTARRGGWGAARALLGRYGRWRVRAGWYGVALVAPPLAMLAALGLALTLGGHHAPFPSPGRWPLVAVNFLAVLLIGGPLGEEAGWRGYALPALQARWGSLRASLAVGALWGLWHPPLFLIPGTPQAAIPFALYLAQAVPLGILFTWLYQGSGGSLLLVALFHASINTWPGPLRLLPDATAGQRPFALVTALVWALAVVVVATGALARGAARVGE